MTGATYRESVEHDIYCGNNGPANCWLGKLLFGRQGELDRTVGLPLKRLVNCWPVELLVGRIQKSGEFNV